MFGIAAVLFVLVGLWAIRLQAQQTRDTTRKHHLEDLEHALLAYGHQHGTYPPDAASDWCGRVSDPTVRTAIEPVLRQNEEYAKPEKPFPADPRFTDTARDYFYWKHSPTHFELLAELEADPNDTRDTAPCGGTTVYDYGIVSTARTPF